MPGGMTTSTAPAGQAKDVQPTAKLVVAVASRALLDFEEENRVFEAGPDDRAYMALQLERLNEPARPGVAFHLVRKLFTFNSGARERVEVVILSRTTP